MVEKEHKAEKFGQMWLSLVLVRMRKTHSDICIERKESDQRWLLAGSATVVQRRLRTVKLGEPVNDALN